MLIHLILKVHIFTPFYRFLFMSYCSGGHGSHVCGSVLGNVIDTSFTGCASNQILNCEGICSPHSSWYGDGICNPEFNCEALQCDKGDCTYGCAAGGSTAELTSNNGMAYNAKLAFFDIGNGGEYLDVPPDLSTVFTPAYSAGARIHSNSWGTGYNGYLEEDSQIDQFTYGHNVSCDMYHI